VKLFLSRDEAGEVLNRFARESGHDLITFSCIRKDILTHNPPPEADWIFFYSPSAVALFLENFGGYQARRATLGEGTARIFREGGIKPDFVGQSPDPIEVMKEFEAVRSKEEKVVQARGKTSFERLREVLPSECILDWPFYHTESKTNIPRVEADVYIFTSPSNAEAYLSEYGVHPKSRVIVFGQSTKTAVEKYTDAEVLITAEPGERGAIEIIQSLAV